MKGARIGNLPAEVQVLSTVREGRTYTIELRVRDVEDLARESGNKSPRKTTEPRCAANLSFEFTKIQNVLSSHFGTKIQLKRNGNGSGRIFIPFDNDEDLNRILELLNY